MKKIAMLTALIFAVGLFVSPACEKALAKELKIGYVDLAKVFDEYKKTKDSEKVLEEKGKVKQDERNKMMDELKKLTDEQALLSDKAKAEKQGAIDAKKKALQEYDIKTRDELVKQRNDILGGIMKDIEKVVEDYAKASGYDFVLNSRMLLYGTDQCDLTNEILGKLNK